MATTTKIPDFLEAVTEGEINLATDTIMIALSNTAPASEGVNPTTSGNGILANVTQISYTNYTDSLTVDRTLQSVTSNESGGTYTFDFADFTITASGGALASFRYIYIYSDTSATPADQLILLVDYGSTVSLASGDSLAFNVNASGAITIA